MSTAATVKSLSTPMSVPAATTPAPGIALSEDNYKFLRQEIYRESGIVLDGDKHYLLESRLMPVLREAKLDSLDELCTKLRTRAFPAIAKQVVEALTTHETLFFRDMAPFDALRLRLLPELVGKNPRKLAIWSAAASSGQEAYSIAMLLQEMGLAERCTEILGTDLSEQVLERARKGKYVQFEVNRVCQPRTW